MICILNNTSLVINFLPQGRLFAVLKPFKVLSKASVLMFVFNKGDHILFTQVSKVLGFLTKQAINCFSWHKGRCVFV